MTFLVVSDMKKTVRFATDMLFSQFPGSVIYQYIDAEEAISCIKTHQIDAVFMDGAWDAKNEYRMLCALKNENASLSVYLFAEDISIEEDALWYEASGFLTFPFEPEELQGLFSEI